MTVETVKIVLGNVMQYSTLKGIKKIGDFIEHRKELHDAEIEREIDHLMILQEGK